MRFPIPIPLLDNDFDSLAPHESPNVQSFAECSETVRAARVVRPLYPSFRKKKKKKESNWALLKQPKPVRLSKPKEPKKPIYRLFSPDWKVRTIHPDEVRDLKLELCPHVRVKPWKQCP